MPRTYLFNERPPQGILWCNAKNLSAEPINIYRGLTEGALKEYFDADPEAGAAR